MWLCDLCVMQLMYCVLVVDLFIVLCSVLVEGCEIVVQIFVFVLIIGCGEGMVLDFGGLLCVKMWMMFDLQWFGVLIGGVVGWLVDGMFVWLGGVGLSNQVLVVVVLCLMLLIEQMFVFDDDVCVVVDFFVCYLICEVCDVSGKLVVFGCLEGCYVVCFVNGNMLLIESKGELMFVCQNNMLVIMGCLGMNDYVVCVVECEGEFVELQVVCVLVVVVCSYFVQYVLCDKGCYCIVDSLWMQCVLLCLLLVVVCNVVEFIDMLVLIGQFVQYYGIISVCGQMSWIVVCVVVQCGQGFDVIFVQWWLQVMFMLFQSLVVGDCLFVVGVQLWLQMYVLCWFVCFSVELGYEILLLLVVCVV